MKCHPTENCDLINQQDLIIVNSTNKCSGLITRLRKTVNGEEKSVLDYFVVCRQLFQKIVKMIIDERRQYVLSRFYKYKTKTTTVECDHNPLILELSFKWDQKIRVDRKEMYNIRNKDCQEFFTENSSFNSNLLKVLKDKDIYRGGAKWMKEVQHLISKSFKKIRITKVK